MSQRRHLVRLVIALLATLLVIAGLQAPAGAATRRTLSVAVSPTATVSGSVVTFSGRLTRTPKGSLVRIQQKSGTSWVLVRSTRTTTAIGRYAAKVTLPRIAATYSFRAVAPRKGRLATAISKTVKVTALKKTFVLLTAAPTTVTAGTRTTLSGIVRPFVKGTSVLIQRRTATTWTNVALATLTADGSFSKAVPVGVTSTFRATISRVGMNAAGVSASQTVTATPGNPVIGTSSLPAATRGAPYSTTLAATGSPAGTWTAAPLPAGLSVEPATGEIHGTPTVAGTVDVTVGFTQTSTGLAATPKTLALTVNLPPAPVITTSSLPDGTQLKPYSFQLKAAGDPSGTWTAGGLPGGFSIDKDTGEISGFTAFPSTSTVTIGFTQTGNPTPATPVQLTLHIGGLGG